VPVWASTVHKLKPVVNFRVLREDFVEDKQLALKQQLVTVVQGPSADDERRKSRPVAQIRTHLRTEETKISQSRSKNSSQMCAQGRC